MTARSVERGRNPFVVGLLATGENFADREGEVARMAGAFTEPGTRLVVYGDRRLGKSSALERAAVVAREGGHRVAIASLATASDPQEAAQRVLSALQREVGRSWRDVVGQIAQRLSVTFEVGPSLEAGGLPTLKFGFGMGRAAARSRLLPEVLDALDARFEEQGEALGLGLDEFQRIHEWGGEDAEWALRESLQRHRAVGYVLAGSRRSLIEAMVTDKGRAFWKIADPLAFGPMDDDVLARWISDRAAATGVTFPQSASRLIVRLARPRTRDVVQLARSVWMDARIGGSATKASVGPAFERIVREQSDLYGVVWHKLGAREQAVLRAFAADPDVQITSTDADRRFHLGPKSSVHSAVERLVLGEHLTRLGPGGYAFDDPYFRRWVQVYGLPDIGEPTPPLEP